MSALGDKFREAARMVANSESDSFCMALVSAGVEHGMAWRTADWFLGREIAFDDHSHRVIALLLAAEMADTGDLK